MSGALVTAPTGPEGSRFGTSLELDTCQWVVRADITGSDGHDQPTIGKWAIVVGLAHTIGAEVFGFAD